MSETFISPSFGPEAEGHCLFNWFQWLLPWARIVASLPGAVCPLPSTWGDTLHLCSGQPAPFWNTALPMLLSWSPYTLSSLSSQCPAFSLDPASWQLLWLWILENLETYTAHRASCLSRANGLFCICTPFLPGWHFTLVIVSGGGQSYSVFLYMNNSPSPSPACAFRATFSSSFFFCSVYTLRDSCWG